MNETRALTIQQPVSPQTWEMIERVSAAAHASRVLGVSTAHEASMKMLAGTERGLPLSTALQCIYLVKGRTGIQPKALWGLILGHRDFDPSGYLEERLTRGDAFLGYAITLRRKNGFSARRQFTLDDAVRAGLAGKDNWRGYPEHCCYWRAMAAAQDVVFGDVCMGLYRADELGAEIDREGNVVEGQWSIAPAPQPAAIESATVTLDELVDRYGSDAVFAACSGALPATDAEVGLLAAVLEAGNG